MKEIQLTHGFVALVDDEDYDYINQWKWRVWQHKQFKYAVRSIARKGRTALTVQMHRVIMKITDSKVLCDHKDHDGLNNQKYNLRKATRSQNAKNKTSKIGSTSKYLGVHFKEIEFNKGKIVYRTKKWCAQIGTDGKTIKLGRFVKEEDAARAYNEAAKRIHGDFANLNKI